MKFLNYKKKQIIFNFMIEKCLNHLFAIIIYSFIYFRGIYQLKLHSFILNQGKLAILC